MGKTIKANDDNKKKPIKYTKGKGGKITKSSTKRFWFDD